MTPNTAPAARHRSMSLDTARARGMRGETFTADELRAFLPADGSEGMLWTSIGSVVGRGEVFATERVRVGAEGLETLGTFDGCPAGTTQVILCRPFGQGRSVRVLTRRP